MANSSNSLSLNNTLQLEEEDDDLVILPDVDNSELIARFQLSLVGRLSNKEKRSVEALIALLPRPNIWDVEGRARGVDLGNHRFQFDFESEADLQKVLSKRPCHFNKWSFALERWTPHVGDSFPHKMTFWVSATGIPTHFWLEPIFKALGKGLGLVGKVEEKAAKFELELDAERPLKFKLRAQLPSGEIVPVTLEYSNLHRWCHHCRLISHEIDTCPQITDEQREQLAKEKDLSRDQVPFPRMEVNRNGENSRRATAPVSKAPLPQERRQGDHPQRDIRDSVWKRIDSRYAPREDYRRDHRLAPREQEKLPHQKETYNKRRYDESFASTSRAKQLARSLPLPQPVTDKSLKERISTNLSPEHVRERPFKLNLRSKSIEDQKLKGKVADLENVFDEGSSAKKSLKFEEERPRSSSNLQVGPLKIQPSKEKEKSWYEQTLEEEEESVDRETVKQPAFHAEETRENVEDPDAEKILEGRRSDGGRRPIDGGSGTSGGCDRAGSRGIEQINTAPSEPEIGKKLSARPSPLAPFDQTTESCPAQTPSSKSRPSPAKKKRSSPSPIATGVSLTQRNLMGRASGKARVYKIGPNLQ
ncbi:PREDICTED: uncharacterized protein LOC106345012 [Brassica oleracea var. oleracea]|uniref:uncharacterized protein LOC106345012 n=1 Tax=Brassica oleracea var. oleracea TaxID=109376 RepID=UPI0006A6F958|nr:PREDICTED: uncharacterized protein LOC106345012 [Brassica oleracea var. oleracea]